MRRIRRFFSTIRWLIAKRLITRHNIRAAWIQSDDQWWEKLPPLGLTDEEIDAFIKAIEEM